jgi:diadenosine tetraphosphate (Ap4A) HIT family hydrolase
MTVFAEILAGRSPASFVYRDDRVAAFMDLHPINSGHTLVVPLEPAAYLADLDPETGAHLFKVAQRIAAAIRSTDLRCEGVNLFLADGEDAGQEVFHVHLHVIPRFAGDGFGFVFPDGYGPPVERGILDEAAQKIKGQL